MEGEVERGGDRGSGRETDREGRREREGMQETLDYLSGALSFASSTDGGPSNSRHSSMIPSPVSPFVSTRATLGPLVMNLMRSSKNGWNRPSHHMSRL